MPHVVEIGGDHVGAGDDSPSNPPFAAGLTSLQIEYLDAFEGGDCLSLI